MTVMRNDPPICDVALPGWTKSLALYRSVHLWPVPGPGPRFEKAGVGRGEVTMGTSNAVPVTHMMQNPQSTSQTQLTGAHRTILPILEHHKFLHIGSHYSILNDFVLRPGIAPSQGAPLQQTDEMKSPESFPNNRE
jgi:hypothetical protein